MDIILKTISGLTICIFAILALLNPRSYNFVFHKKRETSKYIELLKVSRVFVFLGFILIGVSILFFDLSIKNMIPGFSLILIALILEGIRGGLTNEFILHIRGKKPALYRGKIAGLLSLFIAIVFSIFLIFSVELMLK